MNNPWTYSNLGLPWLSADCFNDCLELVTSSKQCTEVLLLVRLTSSGTVDLCAVNVLCLQWPLWQLQ